MEVDIAFNVACELSQPRGKTEFSSTAENRTNLSYRKEKCVHFQKMPARAAVSARGRAPAQWHDISRLQTILFATATYGQAFISNLKLDF